MKDTFFRCQEGKIFMGRFDFLKDDSHDLYALCTEAEKYQKSDTSACLLKCRQALEWMVGDLAGHPTKDLFEDINLLSDEAVLDGERTDLFHQVRRVCNRAVHGEKLSEETVSSCLETLYQVTLWYFYQYKKSDYDELAFSEGERAAVKKFLPKTVKPSELSVEIDPLEIDADVEWAEESDEIDPLKQDVFETAEEFKKRIAAMPPVTIGMGILDIAKVDPYTHIGFLRFHIKRMPEIVSVPVNAFCVDASEIDAKKMQVLDGDIKAKLFVARNKVHCDYNQISLVCEDCKEIRLSIIRWERLPYESQEKYKKRVTSIPRLPLGICKPVRSKYDLQKKVLPIQVASYKFVKDIFPSQVISYPLARDKAKEVCSYKGTIYFYGEIDAGKRLMKYQIWGGGLGEIPEYNMGSKSSPIDTKSKAVAASSQKLQELQEMEISDLRAKASIGNVEARYILGVRYEEKRDFKRARMWYESAATLGHASSQYKLAKMYVQGAGGALDAGIALKWCEKSAAQGNGWAKALLRKLR